VSLVALFLGFGVLVLAAGIACFCTFLTHDELKYLRKLQDKKSEALGEHAPLLSPVNAAAGSPASFETSSPPQTTSFFGWHLPVWISGYRLAGFVLTSLYLMCLTLPVGVSGFFLCFGDFLNFSACPG
jgi:hypothetical protein